MSITVTVNQSLQRKRHRDPEPVSMRVEGSEAEAAECAARLNRQGWCVTHMPADSEGFWIIQGAAPARW